MLRNSSGNDKRNSFDSLDDFKRRVALSKDELRTLAELGALNCFAEHRRAAMWEVEETMHDDLLAETTRLRESALAGATLIIPDAGVSTR